MNQVLVCLDTVTGTGTEVGATGIAEELSDITNTEGYTIHAYESVILYEKVWFKYAKLEECVMTAGYGR